MSKTTRQLAFIGAWTGMGFGFILLIIPLFTFLFNSQDIVTWLILPFSALGVFLLFFGLIGVLGASLLNNYPRIGACILLLSAFGGCMVLYTIIIWAVPALIEIVAAIRAFRETSKTKKFAFSQGR